MKVLYAFQGTGFGHISRAKEIVPLLKEKVETDVLISGANKDLELPFEVKYRMKGLTFFAGKTGGIDFSKTYHKNSLLRLGQEIVKAPVKQYDLVINDFEPVTAWACKLKGTNCVELSHQAAVIDQNAPKAANKALLGKFLLERICPIPFKYGFHFQEYNDFIFTPVIRKQVRELDVRECKNHYTVYLPAYTSSYLIEQLSSIESAFWHIFTPEVEEEVTIVNNFTLCPLNNERFLESMATSLGVVCGAGFETPAEALYLGKKLLVVPMKGQYEQLCNAASLESLGVPVIDHINATTIGRLSQWIASNQSIQVNYPDNISFILDEVLETHLKHIRKGIQANTPTHLNTATV
jgi:uncharacterized protein (TIGR00661 family)